MLEWMWKGKHKMKHEDYIVQPYRPIPRREPLKTTFLLCKSVVQ